MRNYIKFAFFSLSLIFIFFSCSNNGTSTGNPLVSLRYQNFNASLSAFTVNQLHLCFKRVRFKQLGETTNTDTTLDSDNIDFDIGEKSISSAGDLLGDVNVPAGQYARIEFDLDNHCGNGYSVYINNSNGTFSTTNSITIKFQGTFNLNQNTELNLAIQPIITSVNSVSSSVGIKTVLEGVSGSF